MTTYNYVQMPQNDVQQIAQIVAEYSSEPAKGLTHGIQKDAIQNATGARLIEKEKTGYKDWKIVFELIKINGEYALVFTDEGTTGLIGDILSVEQIQEYSVKGLLKADQKLSRFLTRFDSGGGIGAGCFGRGKLIFQGGSKDNAIICDSLRQSDDKYILIDRYIKNNRLIQPEYPYQNDEARKFIIEKTGGALKPLENCGTRVIILNLKKEIIKDFKKSFDEEDSDYMSFSRMIEETWWEIIWRFNAKIYLKWEDKIKEINLTYPLTKITEAKDKEKNWRVYSKKNVPIIVRNNRYVIKELKFIVSPDDLDYEYRDIWIQRRRMKIGSILRGIEISHRISKRFCGYLVLDEKLEELIIDFEGTTHYGFNLGGTGLKQIRAEVRNHVQKFEQILGIQHISPEQSRRTDMLKAMNELNKMAKDLGLMTEFGKGPKSKEIEILIKRMALPNEDSKRIETGEAVGPITLEIKNNSGISQNLYLYITAEQKVYNKKILIYKQDIQFSNEDVAKKINIPEFVLSDYDLEYGQAVLIWAKVKCADTGSDKAQLSRLLWYGVDEPDTDVKFKTQAYMPDFPNAPSRRVEISEVIRNVGFKISSEIASDVKINVDIKVRKTQTANQDYHDLLTLYSAKDIVLGKMNDLEFLFESIEISKEVFGYLENSPAEVKERKCEIFFSARVAENIPKLKLNRGYKIGKKSIEFYLGVEKEGDSIFRKTDEQDMPEEPWRSKCGGSSIEGYVFILNVGHRAYKNAEDLDYKHNYIREEMLKQAYAIAVRENTFEGVISEYKDSLETGALSPEEAFLLIDKMIGRAIIEMD